MITIRQAADLTNRGKATIKRWVIRSLATDPKAKSAIMKETIPTGYRYLIDDDYLLAFAKSETGQKYQRKKTYAPAIKVLQHALAILDKQLLAKDRQIEQNNAVIDQLRNLLQREPSEFSQ